VAKHLLMRMIPFLVLIWAALVHATPLVPAPDLAKDPMRSPTGKSETVDANEQVDISLSAIVYRPKTAMAVINGQRVKVGDVVADATVTRIEPQRVQIRTSEGARWLSLSVPSAVKVRRR
jgi:hypothetical protein